MVIGTHYVLGCGCHPAPPLSPLCHGGISLMWSSEHTTCLDVVVFSILPPLFPLSSETETLLYLLTVAFPEYKPLQPYLSQTTDPPPPPPLPAVWRGWGGGGGGRAAGVCCGLREIRLKRVVLRKGYSKQIKQCFCPRGQRKEGGKD